MKSVLKKDYFEESDFNKRVIDVARKGFYKEIEVYDNNRTYRQIFEANIQRAIELENMIDEVIVDRLFNE